MGHDEGSILKWGGGSLHLAIELQKFSEKPLQLGGDYFRVLGELFDEGAGGGRSLLAGLLKIQPRRRRKSLMGVTFRAAFVGVPDTFLQLYEFILKCG